MNQVMRAIRQTKRRFTLRVYKTLLAPEAPGVKTLHLLLALTLILPSLMAFRDMVQPEKIYLETGALAKRLRPRAPEAPEPLPPEEEIYSETEPSAPPPGAETPPDALPVPPTPTQSAPPERPAPTLSPAQSPTPNPAIPPIAPPTGTLTLTLAVSSTEVYPGTAFQLGWQVAGQETLPQGEELELEVVVPEGFTPRGEYVGTFDPDTNTLTMQIEGEAGRVWWFVATRTQGPYELSAALFPFGQTMRVDGERTIVGHLDRGDPLATAELILGERGVYEMEPRGGRVEGLEGRVAIEFPAGAVTETIALRMQPAGEDAELPFTLSGQAFKLTAHNQATGREITRFPEKLTIEYHYDEETLYAYEGSLRLFFYDSRQETWVPLDTRVDRENNILYATTTHFTYLDPSAETWESARTPTLDSFQVSGFTGAATYGMNFWVPPGPGGLQPSLSLSYNSQTVDGATARTQASWVGMGWALDVGYIERNMHGTDDYLGDDTFSIVMDGVSGMLLESSTANTYYTVDRSFYRIKYNVANDKWTVEDKVGNVYVFGLTSADRAEYPTYNPACTSYDGQKTWKWGLSQITNIHGQTLEFTYTADSHVVNVCGDTGDRLVEHALYPAYIEYPGNTYRIKFTLQPRDDWDPGWDGDTSRVMFKKKYLKNIEVQHYPENISSWETSRKYVFTYETTNPVFPNVLWPGDEDGQTLTLKSVKEYGYDGQGNQTTLPATTFTYSNGMHLTLADNGYGGQVAFAYDMKYAVVGNTNLANGFTGTCSGENTNGWEALTGAGNEVRCHGEVLRFKGKSQLDLPGHITAPGNMLRLVGVDVEAMDNNSTIRFGLNDNGGTVELWSSSFDLPDTGVLSVTAFLTVPMDITVDDDEDKALQVVLDCGAEECKLTGHLQVMRVLTKYRVTSKTITDAVTEESYVTTFSYTGFNYNHCTDPNNDAYYTNCNGQFWGHNTVTKVAPSGLETKTWYHYEDIETKGRIEKVEVRNPENQLHSRTTYTYAVTEIISPNLTLPTPDPESEASEFTDLAVYWVRQTEIVQEKCEPGDGCSYTRREIAYNETYGLQTTVTETEKIDGEWTAFRLTLTGYYPDDDPNYLVGFPAYTQQFSCPVDENPVGVPKCDGEERDLLSAQFMLYDNNDFDESPVVGLLTHTRTFVCHAESSACVPFDDWDAQTGARLYRDTAYFYDTYGNQTQVKTYGEYGDDDTLASSGERQTITTYETYYHTYATQVEADGNTSEPDLITVYTYNYTTTQVTEIEDPNGNKTTFAHDHLGRMTKAWAPGDSTPTLELTYHDSEPFYTEAEQLMAGTTTRTVRKVYNGLGQLIQVQNLGVTVEDGTCPDPTNGTEDTCDVLADTYYDAAGRVWKQSVPYAVFQASVGHHDPDTAQPYVENSYDVLGRTLVITATDQTTTTYSYEKRQTLVTDMQQNTTRTEYDRWGRVTEVHPPEDPWTQYSYDALGRLLTVEVMTDTTVLATTVMTYTHSGWKLGMNDPDMGIWSYEYLGNGLMDVQTDARGCQIEFTYDKHSRIKTKEYSGPQGETCAGTDEVTYTYDDTSNGNEGLGLRTGMDDASGVTSWLYDTRGRVLTETRVLTDNLGTFVTGWTYNSANQVVTMQYPGGPGGQLGEIVTFGYHDNGSLDSLGGTSPYLEDMIYDEAGRIVEKILNEGHLETLFSYYNWTTANGRLNTLKSGNPADLPDGLQSLKYYYDDVGNITQIRDFKMLDQSQVFTYDALNRLETAVTVSNIPTTTIGAGMYEEIYAYDEAGRLATMNNGLTSYAYSAQASTCPAGALTFAHAVTSVGSSAFCYDQNGNMAGRHVEGAELTLTHDAENRLVAADGTAPQTLFRDGFESEDLSAWNSSQTDGGDLSVTDTVTLEADYSLEVDINDANPLYVQDDTPDGETFYRASFRMDPNTLTMGNNEKFELLVGAQDGGQDVLHVRLRMSAGSYQLGLRWYQQSGSWASSAAYSITDAPHLVEVLWAQGMGRDDGRLELWVDGVNQLTKTDLDNDNLDLDYIRFGAVSGLDGGTSGTFYLDSFTSNTVAEVDYTYTYDGDGNRILATHGITQTIYLGGYYEYEVYDHTSEAFFIAEKGQITTLTSTEVTVTLEHTFVNPVVFAQPLSTANTDQAVVRITDVQPGQFSLKVHEPDNGAHTQQETVSYLVLEAGSWELDDGLGGTLRLEVGLVDTKATVGDSISPNVWETVAFGDAFPLTPTVLTQIQSNYDPAWAKTRQEEVNANGFHVAMEPEDDVDTPHGGELIGWLAIEQTTGFTWGGLKMEADDTGDNVTDSWYTLTFNQTYSSAPLLFGWVASRDGNDGAGLRYRNLGTTTVELKLDDDSGAGAHGDELVHYIALATSGLGGEKDLEATGTGQRVKKYYSGMAMRDAGKLYYMLSDHLGSTTEIVDARLDPNDIRASLVSRVRYAPFGAQRYASAGLPTAKTYTGQYGDSYIKLNWYGSRWYDPLLGRFIQPDSIIPGVGNPMAFDRYSYVFSNPLNHTDTSGHCADDDAACWDYLNSKFCKGIDCGDQSWRRWLIVNSDSVWTINELKMVKKALKIVKYALEYNSFDWLEVVGNSWRFERFNMARLPLGFDRTNSIYDDKGVLKGLQLGFFNGRIGLADEAFLYHGLGSFIHEIGHATNAEHANVPVDTFAANPNYDKLVYSARGASNAGERWAEAFEAYILSTGKPDGERLLYQPGYYVNWDLLTNAVHHALSVAVNQ